MNTTRWIAVPLCALLLAACGSSSSGSGSGKKLSQKQFVAQADKICKHANKDVSGVKQPKGLTDYAGIEKYGPAFKDAIDKNVSKLKSINPPDKSKADFEKFVSAAENQAGKGQELADAAKAKDAKKIASIIKAGNKDSSDGKAAAEKAGLKVCAK